MIYSDGGNVSYAVKCELSENCEVEVELGPGLKTYLQLGTSCPQILSEQENDPSMNDQITGIESEEGASSRECPEITLDISVPVSPAPNLTPMPKQG